MSVKARNQLKSLATILSLGGGLVVAVGLIYLFLTPKSYQASVKIRMLNWVQAGPTNDLHGNFDIAAECQVVRSDAILDEAIKHLGLNELWGKRFNQGVPLKPEQSRLLLKAFTVVHPVPKSSLIQIQVMSKDREETATIANEIARIYHDQRQEQRRTLNAGRLAVFQNKWEEASKKVQAAQAGLDKMYLDITRDRTTNPATFYDIIMAKRVDLEGQYVKQQDILARLKAMNQEQLKEALPTLETNTNSLLAATMTRQSKARTDLVVAQSSYAAGSPEVKRATLVANEEDKTLAGMIAGIMTARENEVASAKAALDEMNERLKVASANLHEIAAQDASYAQARQELENLKLERDAIQEKMDLEDSRAAMMPSVVVAEIIDNADPPQKPAIPDGKLAASTIGAGSFAAVAGLFLLLVGQKPKTSPGKN